jgi:Zn-dependent M28 family amino/carboxypeptidase
VLPWPPCVSHGLKTTLGSGTAAILSVFFALVQMNYEPEPGRRLEFHWYAAEEPGLLGSQPVANAYAGRGVTVKGMLQLDTIAWDAGAIGIVGSYVDKDLTNFARDLVTEYGMCSPSVRDASGSHPSQRTFLLSTRTTRAAGLLQIMPRKCCIAWKRCG